MENNNKTEMVEVGAPYDANNLIFASSQKTILDYINDLGDFQYLCEDFPSGEKPVLVAGTQQYYITYNFYNNFGVKRDKKKGETTPIQQLEIKQLTVKFDTSWDTNTIFIDARDIDRGLYPASLLQNKLSPQMRNIKLTQLEPLCWNNITSFINAKEIDLSQFTDFDDIVAQNKVPVYVEKVRKAISETALALKKLKIDWCSLNGVPREDLIIYMTPEMIELFSLNNNLVYATNQNIVQSAEELFPRISGIKIIPSTNQKDNCKFDMLIGANWCCAKMVANLTARIYIKEQTAKDYCLNAQFIGDGCCKFYDPSVPSQNRKCPVLFGFNLKFK